MTPPNNSPQPVSGHAPASTATPASGVVPTAAPEATLVIFGITGDLSHRLLVPSLVNMTRSGLIGENLTVLGISRNDGDDEWLKRSFEQFKGEVSDKSEIGKDEFLRAAWTSLRPRIAYMQGDFADAAMFDQLRTRLEHCNAGNVVFYLATAPHFFGDIIEQLGRVELLDESRGFRRIAIEKPFGRDHESACVLNKRILALASEQQIYRIDHFLGKETVQNIMVARFANTMIAAIWNNVHIDHVQITVAETVDVGTRGEFYDATGALRDMVSNHLFQVLAMVCMEPPASFDAEAIRNEKAKVFRAIRGPRPDNMATDAVRGVYHAGNIGDKNVVAYRATPDVAPDSRTETYVALKLSIDSARWRDVPFYLRTGKSLSHRDSEIVVVFKPIAFAPFEGADLPANKFVIQIQPGEGLALDFVVKRPGPATDTAPARMNFSYAGAFDIVRSTGYETLLYVILTGDQTLFQRADEIEAAWYALQPVQDAWATDGAPEPYPAGSDGPEAAAAMIERDGRRWHALGPG